MQDLIEVKNGSPVITSLRIAEVYEKTPSSVNRTIKGYIADVLGGEIGLCKIAQSEYINAQGKTQPMYELSEEEALIITGRFTGVAAAKHQRAIAKAFIDMRNYIRSQQVTFSQADKEMLEISRIDSRTMKAISKTRNNEKVRENYLALVGLGILEEKVEMVKTTRYRFTAAGADYSNGYHHSIPRFEPELHESIVKVINGFKKAIKNQNDLFIERD
jgi:Rha family phage regulatory protein